MAYFINGFLLVAGGAVGLFCLLAAYWLLDTAVNFAMRYRQSSWYPEKIEQRFGARAAWAAHMTFTGPRLPWDHWQ